MTSGEIDPTLPDQGGNENKTNEVSRSELEKETSAIARPDVPPGQLRAFTAHFVFANLPEPVGSLGWDSRISGTRATE